MIRTGSILLLCVVCLQTACSTKELPASPPVTPMPVPVLKPVPGKVNAQIGGYYEALPSSYNTKADPYPIFVFLHGAGQVGNGSNDLPLLLQEGLTQQLDEKKIPARYSVNGSPTEVLYFSPQFRDRFDELSLNEFLTYIRGRYHIDTTRIYLIGMSYGAQLACRFASAYPLSLTAIVSMAGGLAPDSTFTARIATIANNRIAIWAIHNGGDQLIPFEYSKSMVSALEALPGEHPAIITELMAEGPLGHDAWTRACTTSFNINGTNIYEWLLQFRKS